jgi:aldehyde:ferredoxin oxidoreductase
VARAWAIEAYERDMITPQETLGLPLQWSNIISYLNALEYLVKRPNEFSATLARGTEYAAKKYNSLDFATTLSGQEISGYHTGPVSLVGQLLGIRHSHLDNIRLLRGSEGGQKAHGS